MTVSAALAVTESRMIQSFQHASSAPSPLSQGILPIVGTTVVGEHKPHSFAAFSYFLQVQDHFLTPLRDILLGTSLSTRIATNPNLGTQDR